MEDEGAIFLGKKVATPLEPVDSAGECVIWQKGAFPRR